MERKHNRRLRTNTGTRRATVPTGIRLIDQRRIIGTDHIDAEQAVVDALQAVDASVSVDNGIPSLDRHFVEMFDTGFTGRMDQMLRFGIWRPIGGKIGFDANPFVFADVEFFEQPVSGTFRERRKEENRFVNRLQPLNGRTDSPQIVQKRHTYDGRFTPHGKVFAPVIYVTTKLSGSGDDNHCP